MLTRDQKQAQIEAMQERFKGAVALLAFDYRGVTVAESDVLRAKLRKENAGEYHVMKNTLVKRALDGTPSARFSEFCSGPTAVGIAYEEAGALARVLVEYAKDNSKVILKGAVVDGEVYDTAGIQALSKLPSKLELRGMLAGTLQAPLRNMAGTLHALLSHMRYALDARQKQLEETQAQ